MCLVDKLEDVDVGVDENHEINVEKTPEPANVDKKRLKLRRRQRLR